MSTAAAATTAAAVRDVNRRAPIRSLAAYVYLAEIRVYMDALASVL